MINNNVILQYTSIFFKGKKYSKEKQKKEPGWSTEIILDSGARKKIYIYLKYVVNF